MVAVATMDNNHVYLDNFGLIDVGDFRGKTCKTNHFFYILQRIVRVLLTCKKGIPTPNTLQRKTV